MKGFLLSLLVFLIKTIPGFGQPINGTLAAQLQHSLDSMQAANNIKGISACVYVPGQGIWHGVTGVSFAGTPITSDMEFGIGSNTKLFTAVLILKLYENKLLDIDDSIYHWVNHYNNIDSNITIRQLLNHTSGLADVNDVMGYADSIMSNPNRIYSTQEMLAWVGPPLFKAGNGWSYSNTNYLIAGMIAEKITGKAYDRLLRDSILTPLNLDSTFLDVYEPIKGSITHPWQLGVDINAVPRISLNSASWAAGAMCSTADEMMQWYRELLGKKVLHDNTFKLLTTFVGSGNYGFGIAQTKIAGRTVWQHGGSIRGYTSQMMFDTLSKTVIAVLVNANPAPVMPVAVQLLGTLVKNNALGMVRNQYQQESFNILPNPAQHAIVIDTKTHELIAVSVFDASGKLVFSGRSNSIDTNDWVAGIYTFVVETDQGTERCKLVKE